jgi:hypothetical protein
MPHVIVIIALHKPNPKHLAAQIASLTAQRGVVQEVIAVFDGFDTSRDAGAVEMVSAAGFVSLFCDEVLGVRRAFSLGLEMGLKLASAKDAFFSFADQDDIWHPEKLYRTLLEAIKPGVSLVHCDARVVSEEGAELSPSLHRYEGRTEVSSVFGAILLNSVTGMTAVFPRQTAEFALKLMQAYKGDLLHDHVTAVAAACLGRIVFVDQALVDYRQHGTNQIGARASKRLWRSRKFGHEHIRSYRQTSRSIFSSRQLLAKAIFDVGILPKNIAVIFRLKPNAGYSELITAQLSVIGSLLLQGQLRRIFLAIRIFDASIASGAVSDHTPVGH